MILSISLFEIINVVCFAKSEGCEANIPGCPDPKIFSCIPAFAADATAVNPSGIKTLLADVLSAFPIKSKPIFSNGPRSLPPYRDQSLGAYELFFVFLNIQGF